MTLKVTAFYSDPHFYHANIIKLADRPFANVEEMNRELIQRYNATVHDGDTVIWCGDVSMKANAQQIADVIKYCSGTKILVLGNHDKSPQTMLECGFSLVTRELLVTLEGISVKVNHFPYAPPTQIETPDKYAAFRPIRQNGDEILVHGHTHSQNKVQNGAINASCEAWDYKPALSSEIIALIKEIKNGQK